VVSKKYKILINGLLAPAIAIVLCFSLYHQVMRQPDLSLRWQQIINGVSTWQFWLALLLMPVNWGIEGRKWQLLVQPMQPFGWWRAYQSVLSGCSITMLTPNRVGEYGGRILYVQQGNRIKAISLTIAGSISQLLITLLMGCAGLIFLRFFSQGAGSQNNVLPHFWGDVLLYLSIAITVALFLFYWQLGWLVRLMEKVPALHRITRHISVLDELNNNRLLRLLSLSLGRYIVFTLQYLLLLQAVEVHIAPLLCFWLISVFYLVMAVAPTIGFTELPVRVTASWTLLHLYSSNTLGIGAAALATWLINLVIPAIIGSLLMLRLKIVNDKKDENN
jgi:hypothetical protein